MADGTVTIAVDLDDKGVAKGVGGLEKSLGGLGGVAEKATTSIGSMVKALGLVKLAQAGFDMLKDSISGAISRYDILSNSEKVFENMGFEAKESTSMVDNLLDSIDGLPTPLEEAIQGVQGIAAANGDLDESQKIYSALNNSILGVGKGGEEVNSAIEMLTRGLNSGKISGNEFNTLMNTMGPNMQAVAKEMGVTTGELQKGLSDGTISVEDFTDTLIKMDEDGGGGMASFQQQAVDMTKGIGTSMSNMKTAVVRGMANIIEAIDDGLQAIGLPTISGMIQEFSNLMSNVFKKIAGGVGPLIEKFAELFNVIGDSTVLEGTIQIFEALGELVEGTFNGIKDVFDAVAKPLMDWWTDKQEEVAEVTGDAWEAIKEVFIIILYQVQTIVENVFGRVADFITENQDDIYAIIDDVWNLIKDVFEFTMNIILPMVINAFDAIAEYIDVAMDLVFGIIDIAMALISGDWEGAWEAMKEMLGSIWESIKEVIGLALDNVDILFNGAWTKLKEFTKETWEGIKETITDVWEGIVEFFTETIPGIVESIVEWFAELPARLQEKWDEIIEAVTIWVADMVEKAIEIGTDVVDEIVRFFEELPYNIGFALAVIVATVVKWVAAMILLAWEVGSEFVENVMTFFRELPGKVKAKWDEIIEAATKWGKSMWEKAKETGRNFVDGIITFMKELPGKLKAKWDEIIGAVTTWGRNMWTKAKETGRDFIDGVIQFVKELPGKIKKWLDSVIDKVKSWGPKMADKGKEGAQQLVDDTTDKAKELPGKIYDVGVDLIKGLWNGIKSVKDWVQGKIGGFMDGVIDGVKAVFDSNSPSMVFAQIGEDLNNGLVMGIEDKTKSVYKAMDRMTAGVIDRGKVSGEVDIASNFVSGAIPKIQGKLNSVLNVPDIQGGKVAMGMGRSGSQSGTTTNNNDNGVNLVIEKIENNSDSDIPRILEESAWIMEGKRRGQLDG